jgi:hypothetical protein
MFRKAKRESRINVTTGIDRFSRGNLLSISKDFHFHFGVIARIAPPQKRSFVMY